MKLLIFCALVSFVLYVAAEDVEKETKSDDVQTLTKRAPSPAFKHIGCFRDGHRRALPVYLGTFHRSIALRKCATLAKMRGYSVFSVQHRGRCFSGRTADRTYYKYGRAKNCKNGLGGTWANDVYRFTEPAGQKFRKINRRRVCFGAKGNRPGTMRYLGASRIVNGLMLVYRSGAVSCSYRNRKSYSRWGCGGRHLNVVVTDQYNYLIYPRKQYFLNRYLWYQLPGKHSKYSSSLFFANVAAPFHLIRPMQLKVWYAEDLLNHTEGDNRGHVCVDVYAWFA